MGINSDLSSYSTSRSGAATKVGTSGTTSCKTSGIGAGISAAGGNRISMVVIAGAACGTAPCGGNTGSICGCLCGRYFTHQNANVTPLSNSRFLRIYATTLRNRMRLEMISMRSRRSERSSAVTSAFDVVRSVPNEL